MLALLSVCGLLATRPTPDWVLKENTLRRGEIAKVMVVVGSRPVSIIDIVHADGVVFAREKAHGKRDTAWRWKMSREEIAKLRKAIEATDFDAVEAGERATLSPSAVDADDVLCVVRQHKGIRWWSNVVWVENEPLPVMQVLNGLLAHPAPKTSR